MGKKVCGLKNCELRELMATQKNNVIPTLNALIKLEKSGKKVGIIAVAEGDTPTTTILLGCGIFNRTRYLEIKNMLDKFLTEK